MMKYPFILLMLLLSVSTFGQFQRFENCEEAENTAVKDFRDGNLIDRIHGLVELENPKFEKFYELYLYSEYNIKTSFEGCIVSETDLCYTKKMNELMAEKFGDNFRIRTRDKLMRDFEKLSDSEKAEILDMNKTYYENLDSRPKFIGNDKEIREFLKSISTTKADSFSNVALLKIDTDGTIIDFKLENDLVLKNKSNYQNYLKKMNEFGKWVPAYIYNKKVKAEIPFLFE